MLEKPYGRVSPFTLSLVLTIVVAVTVLLPAAMAQGQAHFPNFINVGYPSVRASFGTLGISATTSNAAPLRLTAQLEAPLTVQVPLKSTVLPLAALPGGVVLTPASGSVPFQPVCVITTGGTMAECTLTPPGPPGTNWSAGILIVRVQLTATDGSSAVTLAATTIGYGGSSLQVQFQGKNNPGPAWNNNTPLLLVAQLARTGVLGPWDSPALTIANWGIIPAANSSPFSANCVLTNNSTNLECVLSPQGATWGVGPGPYAPVLFRLHVDAADGNRQVSLQNYRF